MTAAAPLLRTERLDLWLPRVGDMEAMAAIVAHPETGRYLGPSAAQPDQFNRFMRNAGSWQVYGYGGFIVRLKDSPEVIGNCGVFHSWRGLGEDFDDRAEAGWIVAHDHVGRGIAAEAMRAALAWFDARHGPQAVVCMIAPENAPSIGLAGKLGFAPTRLTELPDGEPVQLFERRALPQA